jgi:hypothetical protein
MKIKKIHIIYLVLFLNLVCQIHSGTSQIVDSLNYPQYYLFDIVSVFSVPTSYISSYDDNDADNSNLLKEVFDCKLSGHWFSLFTTNVNITVTFIKTLYIKEILFEAIDSDKGFPNEMKIYTSMDGTKNAKFTLADTIKITPSNKRVLITFSKVLSCRQMRIMWDKKNMDMAQIKQMILLFPITNYINYNNLNALDTSDYKRTTLKKTFTSAEVEGIRKDLTSYGYNEETNKYFSRIIEVASGAKKYDSKREFSTDPKAKVNIIYQRGDIEKYAKNILKGDYPSTNRQPMGIYARANEKIKVYVKSDKSSNPLPKIQFSQYVGRTNNWLGLAIQLKDGEQILTCDNFRLESDYDKPTFPGGPLYIINPYISSEQGIVSIYVEGGEVFPIFRLGDNEETYKTKLLENINLNKKNNKTYFDITELYGTRVMISAKASVAYKIYSNKTLSKGPQNNMVLWDEFLKKLLIFDGVQFSSNQEYYDVKNNYVNVHLRYTQTLPRAYAFATSQYVGLFKDETIDMMLNFNYKTLNWAFAHEIGHTLDIPERRYSEITNNMLSEYFYTVLKGDNTWSLNEHLPNKLKYLVDDTISNNLRGCSDSNTANCKGFFTNTKYNYLVFWDLESINHGYWGKIDNMYRYDKTVTTALSKEEKFVYFSSIIFKMDLGYYFSRWGLSFDTQINTFNENKVSSKYKELMNAAINKGLINKNAVKKKFWYLDNKEYMFISNINTGCYKDKSEFNVQITSVVKSGNNYKLTLPNIKCPGHLGFEIYENTKLIAFTHETTYIDTNTYNAGYVPKYKIVAYDRLLETSNPSSYKSTTASVSLKLMNLNFLLNE